MKLLNFDKVLCLSPHPDDVEYSMSGMIQKYSDTHFSIFVMSFGGEDDPTSGPMRFEEVNKFWELMDVDNVDITMESGYISRHKESKWINKIETKFLSGVECLILPSGQDAHFEHRIVNSVANPLSRKSPLSILEYKSPSTTGEWIPNFFVDLDYEIYDNKASYLWEAFSSQNDAPYFDDDILHVFHSDFSCRKRGIVLVEMFKIIQLFSHRD